MFGWLQAFVEPFVEALGGVFWHDTDLLIIPPTTTPIYATYVPEPRTKALIIGVTFGTPREYDPSTGTFGAEIESMDIGFWHATRGKMDWHWDPLVKSILMTNPYPQLIWCDASKPYELLIVNNTSTTVAIDATFWIIRFPKRVWCPVLERYCDPEELWNRYMSGIVQYFVRQAVEGERQVGRAVR